MGSISHQKHPLKLTDTEKTMMIRFVILLALMAIVSNVSAKRGESCQQGWKIFDKSWCKHRGQEFWNPGGNDWSYCFCERENFIVGRQCPQYQWYGNWYYEVYVKNGKGK